MLARLCESASAVENEAAGGAKSETLRLTESTAPHARVILDELLREAERFRAEEQAPTLLANFIRRPANCIRYVDLHFRAQTFNTKPSVLGCIDAQPFSSSNDLSIYRIHHVW